MYFILMYQLQYSKFIIYFCSHWSISLSTSTAASEIFNIHFSATKFIIRHAFIKICSTSMCLEHSISTIIWTLILRFIEYFGESLPLFGHSRSCIFEWEIAPVYMISSKAYHILYSLSTRSTIYSFGCKHWIIICTFTFQWHK